VGEPCVIVCRSCSPATKPLMIPFRSYRERSLWAAGHTARTGHEDTVAEWIGERP
jgi:hypothetical protein